MSYNTFEVTSHVIVQSGQLTLPAPNGDVDRDSTFTLRVDALHAPRTRDAYLLYRVNLTTDDPAHLVLRINGEHVVDSIVRDGAMQSLHKVISAGVLRQGNNTFTVRTPDDQPGTVVLADVVLVYRVAIFVQSSADDPPASTSGSGF